jgi:hypothetical protein
MITESITKYSIENLTLAFHENLQTLIYLLEDHKIIGNVSPFQVCYAMFFSVVFPL